MLTSFGKHGLFDLTVAVEGDRHIDAHHSVEDAAIALGQAFAEAAGDKAGVRRFGQAVIPMDEALVSAAVDLSGRPYLVHTEPDGAPPYLLGGETAYATTLTRHVFESFTYHAKVALHVTRAGRDGTGTTSPKPSTRRWRGRFGPRPNSIRDWTARFRRPRVCSSRCHGWSCSTTGRAMCARPCARWSGPGPRWN